ncbi:MAG: metallophosphoesterase [Clostridia bacterium]|nr:metallophosphoesterase [Clostridia bacterium]
MKKLLTELNIGIAAPIKVIHFSDTHLTRADGRDDERKIELAKQRRANAFPDNEEVYRDTLALVSEGYDAVLHTGDLIDFVSYANLEEAAIFAQTTDCFFAAGNHEFSLYVGEAKEDAAYRNQSLERVQAAFRNDIRFSSRMVGGVNFVAIDNSYYLFEEYQLEGLKKEAEKGLPIILLLHNPIYEESLYEFQMRSSPCAYLVAAPEEKMECYPSYRREQQRADEITLEAVEYIKNEPSIKALLCGHLHKDFECELCKGKPQMMVGIHSAREIIIR